MPSVAIWMDLEIVILNEEKAKYHMIPLICGKKFFNGTNVLVCRTEIRVTDVGNKPVVAKEDLQGGINWKIEIEIYRLLYIK